MTIIAFAGPSMPADPDPAIDWRPPASAGDMLTVMPERPERIVLIDGYFAVRPAPWHKEILLLMEQGIPVIGAASMGALRAAELAPYGMIGVGAIFAAYRSGRLVADDEVAVLHAPRELGWRALTEPLVNVRANLLAAVRGRVIRPPDAKIILRAAATLNFRDRHWRRILEHAGAHLDAGTADTFGGWLAGHRIDLKALDAAQAIRLALDAALPAIAPVAAPRTSFLRHLSEHVGVGLPPLL
ncbi:TfuA-like protein [Sphingomonas sp.]|uniref:TfuA-like protein n=1 Tax=Sphingomonas sp. TaxID=28214 RepID=UPI000DB000DF|nr:TfuA-like protein [Sphingomonas sp.]PZU10118.1 MAG: tfuA protein [Sphingomonas sp.]